VSEYKITVDGKEYKIDIASGDGTKRIVTVDGKTYEVEVEATGGGSKRPAVVRPAAAAPAAPVAPASMPKPAAAPAAGGAGAVVAPMPGKILRLNVKAGDAVKAGDVVLVLEARKMENLLNGPSDGTVTAVKVEAGADVGQGQLLLEIG